MNKIQFILIGILLFSIIEIQAQPRNRGMQNPSGEKPSAIIGKIIDLDTKHAIPYTTIAVYNQSDSALVTGGITDDKGKFFIKIKNGEYYLDVNFIGYEKIRKNNIIINNDNKIAKVGQIKLKKSLAEIEGVNIVDAQSYVDYKIDRKVINIDRDLAATGSSAVEALQNAPSVTVDIEGNVQLRGSSNFTVLINGKPSPLSGGDALEQIPTTAIKNIEIITNPSAKYDPDGMTGIINIILKDNVRQGLNGIIEASAAMYGSYGFNTILNYRKNKFNYYGGVDLRRKNHPGEGKSEMRNFASDTNFLRSTEIDRLRHRHNYSFKGGIDYFANDRNTFSIEGVYGLNDWGKDYFSRIYERTDPKTIREDYTTSDNTGSRQSDFMKANFSWQHKFKKKGDKLDVLFFINKGVSDKEEFQEERFSDANWTPDLRLKQWSNTIDASNKIDFRFKADYTKLLKKSRKLEMGIQSRNYRENSSFVYNMYDTTASNWQNLPDYGNTMIFNRDILSAYTTFGGMHKNFGYQIGLRGEYTKRIIESSGVNSGTTINRFDIFPTVHLSQKINSNNSIMASYSRRIDRPSGWELSPNPKFISSKFKRVGNPYLEPEYTDSYELSYQKTFKKSFISLEAYYRTTKNKISRIQAMDEFYVTTMKYANLDRDHSAGMEIMANLQINKKIRLNVSGNYYYYKMLGNIESGAVDQQSNNYDLRSNINFMITPLMRFQVTAFYRGPSKTAQGDFSEFYMINSALRYDFFKRKLSVTLKVNNITNSANHKFTTYTSTYTSAYNFSRIGPVVSLTATYKINNYKKKRGPSLDDREKSGGDDI